MRTIIFALFAVALASSLRFDNQFKAFVSRFDKNYLGQELAFREKVFEYNMDWVNDMNQVGHMYTLGVTPFADMTNTEFANSKLCGCMLTPSSSMPSEPIMTPGADAIDWREKGAVMPVKDQARCGSCWAFSANVALEGGNFLYGVKKLIGLSEQQLVDCDPKSNGCKGGLMTYAFQYVMKHGLCSEIDYPYHALDEDCKDDTCVSQIKIKGYTETKSGDGIGLKAAIAKIPVSVAVQASSSVWQLYKEGILDSTACGTSLNHGVGAIGYAENYLIVKNSWGTKWGMKGIVHILHQDTGKGICGINQMNSYPTF